MIATEDVTRCRSCASGHLEPLLDLGSTPIANRLIDPSDLRKEPTFPLRVVLCMECSLVQLGVALPANAIFDEAYPYYSSYSAALSRHAAEHTTSLRQGGRVFPGSLVVEVASNDGYLLRNLVESQARLLGVEPSPGPAAVAMSLGLPTIVDFFGSSLAADIRHQHGSADVIIANNVLAHVPDLNDFVAGLTVLLADDGVINIENPWVRSIVENVEFDTIYHEHYSYFSCTSLSRLMERHGLYLNDVELFPDLHGGTLRWHVARSPKQTDRCHRFLEGESAAGLGTPAFYRDLACRASECQSALRCLVDELNAAGRTVVAYGAAAKGSTLLNTTGLDVTSIAYVVDRNEHKHGKLMPGCRLPIRPVEALEEARPDDIVLLAWNFATEIVSEQQHLVDAGTRFWAPVPLPHEVVVS